MSLYPLAPANEVTPEWSQAVSKLLAIADLDAGLRHLTDAELAGLLVERVWAELDACSPEAAIVSAAVERLEARR